ncbi:MAG TPA: AbrB/MazE/SpoVT family DNA-binding domain-containing protein [Bryobacteraceae bacterium]|nr:AbrB/MazE/SpoVT family DNA-binding domain-containing protein [Bryobacteraceae bacterium]
MIATIDQAGRVVVPKSIRDALRLGAGDVFEISIEGDRIVLAPNHGTSGLIRKKGRWVFSSGGGHNGPFVDPVEAAREARNRQILGEDV